MTDKRTASFGPYTLDLRSGEFRKFGVRVKMGEQPFQILAMLLEKPGEMVGREDLRAKLWPSDTFVDFDHGLNSAVQRLRDCLADTAENPQWVETVPRRGYRFAGKVEWGTAVGGGVAALVEESVSTASTAVQVQKPVSAAAPRRSGVTWIAGVVAVGVLVTLWYSLSARLRAKPAEPFQSFASAQITNNEKSIEAAISPDGKYVVYVVDDQGEQSVWLHHVPTNSDAQVIAPSKSYYVNLTFSRDGNFFYFRRAKVEERSAFDLFRAPVLGGAPQRIVRDADTGISLTADGSRMLYGRSNDPTVGLFLILTANADGTDEKVVWSEDNNKFPEFMTWSADEKQLVTLPMEGANGAYGPIEVRNVETGKVDALVPSRRMYWSDLEWLPKGRGLLLAYQRLPNIFRGAQIGFLSSLGGELRQVTNDTNNYQTMTLSADGHTIAAVQQKIRSTLYFLPSDGFSGATPSPAPAQVSDAHLFSWAADGDVYFTELGDLLEMSRDGRSKATILHDSNAAVMQMSVCPGDKYALVTWAGYEDETKVEMWRINADGSNPKRLTNSEHNVVVPGCDPNGKFAYYDDPSASRIMRVPLESGSNDPVPSEPVPGTGIPNEFFFAYEMSISLDGKWLAMMVAGAENPNGTIVLVPLNAGPNPITKLIRPDPRVLENPIFTPDGKAVVYPVREKGVENLWLQPIDGGRGRQITNFQSDEIGNFQFSPDGKTLGVLQKHVESDVVLLKDTSGK